MWPEWIIIHHLRKIKEEEGENVVGVPLLVEVKEKKSKAIQKTKTSTSVEEEERNNEW